jgi:hypothetical protein
MEVERLRRRITELEAHVKLLREALTPFAALAGEIKGISVYRDETHVPCSMKKSELEAAATALRETGER